MKPILLVLFCLLAACSSQSGRDASASYDLAAEDNVAQAPKPESSGPKIAYSYDIGYRIAAGDIGAVQARHIDLCRRLGPNRCLVLESNIATAAHDDTTGRTALVVDARLASTFGRRLDALVAAAGGTVADRKTSAEDVTKQVIDADSEVVAKEALAERLLGLIRFAKGSVGDLVEAEKAYAETQQQLAAARSLRAVLRQRVAMSRVDVTYASLEARGPMSPIRGALVSAAETIGWSIGALITVVLAALPWALALTGLAWIARRTGWRGPIARWRARRASRTPA